MALQAKQQGDEAEESLADSKWIRTDITVSISFLFSIQMVLTSHSPIALVK